MKLAIISIIISLLSMVECDPCGPSHFSTSSGCKKCFCSGATDKCHAGSFYTGAITGGIDDIKSLLEIYEGPEVMGELIRDIEAEYRFSKELQDFRFTWILPSKYCKDKVRSYGGKLNVTQTITAPFNGMTNDFIRVALHGDVADVVLYAKPVASSENNFEYSIPLEESSWKVVTEDYRLATRDDMLGVLAGLQIVFIGSPYAAEIEAVSVKNLSMDVAVDTPYLISSETDLIEICQCPRGYSGESCQSCSSGYYRDVNNKAGSVFGTCRNCPCHGDSVGCEVDEFGKIMCECSPGRFSSDCNMIDFSDKLRNL